MLHALYVSHPRLAPSKEYSTLLALYVLPSYFPQFPAVAGRLVLFKEQAHAASILIQYIFRSAGVGQGSVKKVCALVLATQIRSYPRTDAATS
jgi:hypothetical protein